MMTPHTVKMRNPSAPMIAVRSRVVRLAVRDVGEPVGEMVGTAVVSSIAEGLHQLVEMSPLR
tara:strand:+ start:574 stop:759 length:186 start_codon:yes stop_codon:yes gene_type:complete